MRVLAGLVGLILLHPGLVLAEPPSQPLETFRKAKATARDRVYHDRPITLYCGCYYQPTGKSGGKIDPHDCGYKVRKSETRGRRLEWEHVVPASRIAGHRKCWKNGHDRCSGKGRRCCEKPEVDDWARHAINDLHNLTPSVGELNADRSNYPYGEVSGEERKYGACDFEVGGTPKVAEPHEHIRGNVARIWLYVHEAYLLPAGVGLTDAELTQFEAWMEADPISDWELERDARIGGIQGNSNPFVAVQEDVNGG